MTNTRTTDRQSQSADYDETEHQAGIDGLKRGAVAIAQVIADFEDYLHNPE